MGSGPAACAVFISKRAALVVRSAEDENGEVRWLKPVISIKGRPTAEEIGAAVLLSFNYRDTGILKPSELLHESEFKTWDELTSEASMLSVALNGTKAVVSPYFSGAGGEYYLVLNRDREVDANAFEIGNAIIKSMEYCK